MSTAVNIAGAVADSAEERTKVYTLPPDRNDFRDGFFKYFDKENDVAAVDSNAGKAFYDQTDRQAWEVVMRGSTIHFVLKRNLITAPDSKLWAEIEVDAKTAQVKSLPDRDAVDKVILHHMVNTGRFFARGASKDEIQRRDDEFYACLPICRAIDRVKLIPSIPRKVFEAFEDFLASSSQGRITRIATAHKYLGVFTYGEEFQTFDTSDNLIRASKNVTGPAKVAKIARDQVNHPKWDGTIRLDGHLCGRDLVRRSILLSADENDWGQNEWDDFTTWLSEQTLKKQENRLESTVDVEKLAADNMAIKRNTK